MNVIKNQNLFQIKCEDDIMEIINDNLNKLIIIFFVNSSDNTLKKFLLDNANTYQDVIFLYINILNYDAGNQFIINNVPSIVFFYNKDVQLVITVLDYEEINKYIKICISKLLK